MLYDRPYMRQAPEPVAKQTSAVRILLIVTISIFVLQHVLNVSFPGIGGRQNLFLSDWFALSSENFKELKVWTVFSYAFLHSTTSIMHILGNMLGLFFMGRILEPLLGKQQFFVLYFIGALAGGLAFLLCHLGDNTIAVGASGAVCALVSVFCLRYPLRPITLLLFFIIPVTIKPKTLLKWSLIVTVFGMVSYEIAGPLAFAAINNGNDSIIVRCILSLYQVPMLAHVAHSAHLGGFLVGVLYFRYVYNGKSSFTETSKRPSIEMPEWFKRRKKTAAQSSYQVNRPTASNQDLQKEVDRILDKINDSGFGSLNPEEKATLDRAKDILSK